MSDAITPEARAPDRLDTAPPIAAEAGGCSSKDTMRAAAAKAGKGDLLDHRRPVE